MVDIVVVGGITIHANPDAVDAVAGPSLASPDLHVEVFGVAPNPVSTLEDPAAILARLHPSKPFARLTRPDNSPIWVRGSAVSSARAPLAEETLGRPPGTVQSVIYIEGFRQLLREDIATLGPLLTAAGSPIFS